MVCEAPDAPRGRRHQPGVLAPALRSVLVANLDNPAGRLYALLTKYDAASRTNPTVERTWGEVLGTADDVAIVIAMAEMAGMVSAVDAAVSRHGRSAHQDMCKLHIEQWSQPFLSGPASRTDLVDTSAMVALNALADFLSENASEGVVPDEEERQSLREELLAVIEETRESDETPVEVRQLILERLHQIVWAIDHVHIGGPDAVTAAVERLAGSVAVSGPQAWDTPPAKHSWNVAKKVWNAFKRGPEAQQALAAWSDVITDVLSLGP